jgi:hypothetical protein
MNKYGNGVYKVNRVSGDLIVQKATDFSLFCSIIGVLVQE